MKKFLLATLIAAGTVRSTLTADGVVTASSYDNNPSNYYAQFVVDGNMSNDHGASGCPGCFRTQQESGSGWINVKLSHPSVVFTVILINREDSKIDNLGGSEIRVGNDPLPQNNMFCAYADTSGAYECSTGLQGTFVGIYNPKMNGEVLQLCEIRAYPWIGNQFTASIISVFSVNGFPVTNALDFVTDVLNDSLAKNNKANDSRYVYTLSSTVHVYATILIGDPSSDFRNTRDWYVTAGTNGLSLTNQAYTAYQGTSDRFGLETKIDALASKVAFIRTTSNEQFNTIYAAVFATSKDCASINFNWSDLIASSPYRFPLRKASVASYIPIDPKSDIECVLALEVKLQSGLAIPSFMSVNTLDRKVSVTPTQASDVGIYNLNVIATYWNGVSPLITSNKDFSVEIFAATQLVLQAPTAIPDQTYKIGDPELLLNLPSYSYLPPDAEVNLIYNLSGQPSFVKIVGSKISIYQSQPPGSGPYVITVGVTDSLSGLTSSTQFTLKIACYQTFTPSGVQSDLLYIINNDPLVAHLPPYDVNSSCTPQLVYQLTLADGSPLPAGFSFNPDAATLTLTIYSQDTTLSANYNLVLRVDDSNTLNFENSIKFQVKIYCFGQIRSASAIPDITYKIDPLNPSIVKFDSPQFVGQPIECPASLSYTLTLQPQVTQPTPFVTFDKAAGLTLSTGDVSFAGVYTFILIATDQTSSVQNVDSTFQVTLVCSPNKIFLLSNGITDQVFYIGSPPLVVPVPTYQTLPTQCKLDTAFSILLEDVNSPTLPSFISPATPTSSITIQTADNALTSQPFPMRLRASIDANQNIFTEFEFAVIIKKCAVQSVDLKTGGNIGIIKYKITSGAVTFQAPFYAASPSLCAVDIQVQLARRENPSASLQEFITYQLTTGIVHIETNNSSLAGSYQFFFKATDLISGVINSSVTFQLDLQANELTLEADPVSDVNYNIAANSPVITIPLPKYNAQGQIQLSYELVLLSFTPAKLRMLQAVQFPPFITQYPTSDIIIQTSDVTLAGVYLFKIIVKDTFSNLVNDTVRFQVTLNCQSTGIKAVYDSKTLTQVSFTIKQDTISFPVPRYETTPKSCVAQPISLSLQNLRSDNLPSFISLNNGVIRLSGGLLQEGRKTFSFIIVASSDYLENRDFKFEVTTLINNQAPYFLSELKDMNLKINADNSYPTWSLPQIKDKENDQIVQTLVGLGDAKEWLAFDSLTGVFKVNPESIQAGEFIITVSITDSSGSVADFSFKISVEPGDATTEEPIIDQPELEIPNQKSFAELYTFVAPASSYIAQNGHQSIIITPLLASLSKPDLNGGFKVKFSELVFMLIVDAIKGEHIISIDILWKNPEYQAPDSIKPQYNWSVRNMTNEFLQFQLEFNEPLQISQGKQPDVLVVRFQKRTYFRRRTDNEALNESCILLMQPIPMQAPNQQEAIRITDTLQQFKGISGTTIFILLFYGMMNLPKSLFWSLHGTIQFVVYEPMHGGKYPSNVVYLYLLLNKLSNMTFDKAGEYLRKIFNPKLPEGTNNALVSAGIFIGVIVLFVVAIIGFTLLRKLLLKCNNGRYIDKLLITEIRRTLMFSSILRFAQLGYMYIVVTSTSAIFGGQQRIFFKSKGETINSLIFYALFAFAVIYPIGVTLFLMIMGPQRLAREAIIEKFRSLYLSLRLNSRVNLLVTVNFLVRRAIVGTSIAVLGDRYEFQLIILLLTCLYCAVLDFAIMPFSEKQLNLVQMMNESFLLLSVYMMHLFSDFVPDDATRYQFGWYFVYLVFIIFGANMIIIGGHMLIDLCEMQRRYWTKKSIKRKIIQTLSEQKKRRRERQGSVKKKILQKNRNGLLESIKEVPEDDDIFSSFESASLEASGVQLLSNASTLPATKRQRLETSHDSSEVRPYLNTSELQENTLLNTERPLLLSSDRQPRFDTPRRMLQSDVSGIKQGWSGRSGRSASREKSLHSHRNSQEDYKDYIESDSESKHSAIHVIEEVSEERYKLNSNSPSRAQSRMKNSGLERLSLDLMAEDSPIIPQIQSAEQSCISISELKQDALLCRKSSSVILKELKEVTNIEILEHDRRRMTRDQTSKQNREESPEDPYGGESKKSSKMSSSSASRRQTLQKLKSQIQSMQEAIEKYTSMCQTPELFPDGNTQSPVSNSSTNVMMQALQDNQERSTKGQKTSRLFITTSNNLEQAEKFNYPTTCVSPTALGPTLSRNPLSRAAASTFEEPLSQSGLIQFDSAFAPKDYKGKQSALPVSANMVSVNCNDRASNATPWILSNNSDQGSKQDVGQKYAPHFSSIRFSNDHTHNNPYELKSPLDKQKKGLQQPKKSMDLGVERNSLISLQQSLKQISNLSHQGKKEKSERRTVLASSGNQIMSMAKSITEERRPN